MSLWNKEKTKTKDKFKLQYVLNYISQEGQLRLKLKNWILRRRLLIELV